MNFRRLAVLSLFLLITGCSDPTEPPPPPEPTFEMIDLDMYYPNELED
jgi:hypothetical protein